MPANKYQREVLKKLVQMLGCSPSYAEVRRSGMVRYKWQAWDYRRKLGIVDNEAQIEEHFLQKATQIKGKGIQVYVSPNRGWCGPYLAVRVKPIGTMLKGKRGAQVKKQEVTVELVVKIKCTTLGDRSVTESRQYGDLIHNVERIATLESHNVLEVK